MSDLTGFIQTRTARVVPPRVRTYQPSRYPAVYGPDFPAAALTDDAQYAIAGAMRRLIQRERGLSENEEAAPKQRVFADPAIVIENGRKAIKLQAQGHSYAQIAAVLQISRGSVANCMRRARKAGEA